MMSTSRTGIAVVASLALAACGKKVEEKKADPPPQGSGSAPAPAAAPGVDLAKKVVRIGSLNDESGPAKQVGVPFAVGKRLLVKAINEGGLKVLPEGWKLEIVEKDHGYNPQQSVQLYKEIKDSVLWLANSFGTHPTLPLVEDLKRDNMLAFPASLSSLMAKNEETPPLGTSYMFEGMRAMDWAVEKAGGADKVKAAIVSQRDDYGDDGLTGWKKGADFHKVKLVSEQTIKPTDQDFTVVVKALKDSGATHVLLTVLPSAMPGILGTAAKLKYAPTWIGNTPSWVDVFFAKLPPPLVENYYYVTGFPVWGEESEGMKQVVGMWEKYGKEMLPEPDFYLLLSWAQGMIQVEALKRAIEANDVTRAGLKKALHTIKDFTAGGLMPPSDLSSVPYVTSTKARILKPKMGEKKWEVISDYAEPKSK